MEQKQGGLLPLPLNNPPVNFAGIKKDKNEWARQDSNLRPNGYEPSALPLSYGPTF
jgi:hypothetical protein